MHALTKSAVAMLLAIPLLVSCSTGSTTTTNGPDEKREHESTDFSQKLSDAGISTRIKTAYIFNEHLAAHKIDVDTHDGTVTLSGTVRSDIEKELAEEIAKNVAGTRSVENRLQIGEEVERAENDQDPDRTFGQAVKDATTTASVKTALAFEKGVKASDINVTTRWGTVTLTGTVATKKEAELAKQTAAKTAGVKEVVSEIQVRG
ncbi:MAG TPA: BON domain-containing protein [Candidatus Polarisedimenticolia bacterium]|nr:BON domain-containing protein [Candidatus Polarisedimenticolia bacterium]